VAWAAAEEDDHDHGHGHGGKDKFEWAGIFEMPEKIYLWTAQKTKPTSGKEKYVDPAMKLVVYPAKSATEATLDSLKSEGNEAMEQNCEDVTSGGVIHPQEHTCWRLVFKEDWWQTLFTIDTHWHAAVAFFAEHKPTEFENNAHYLKDDHGHDIEPIAELPHTPAPVPAPVPEEEKHWGAAIVTAILVNIVTLAGIVFLVPVISQAATKFAAEFECVTAGFAAGAISSCAFFLLLFESTHLIAVDHKKEVDVTWRWGTMILAGALFPVCAHFGVDLVMPKLEDKVVVIDQKLSGVTPQEGDAENSGVVEETVDPGPRGRIISSVLIGDFMHNLCDGFFIGAAFKGCGASFGWTVAWSTIAHEFAQELGDYCVLTGPDCKLRPVLALGLNFLSGTSVLLGVIIVLSSEVGKTGIGLLLAFGGGTYLYIALVECMPKLHNTKVSIQARGIGIALFMVGAIAIGLVLLDHEHCVPPRPPGAAPAADPHAGHNH
jgi:zinc transporter ZupT